MNDDDLKGLIGYVFHHLEGTVCSGTLRHARNYCQRSGLDEAATVEFLEAHGGYCDCEILMNVGPAVEERLRA